ncbi:unnamed protein product, partial [Iphiclides podalirius]
MPDLKSALKREGRTPVDETYSRDADISEANVSAPPPYDSDPNGAPAHVWLSRRGTVLGRLVPRPRQGKRTNTRVRQVKAKKKVVIYRAGSVPMRVAKRNAAAADGAMSQPRLEFSFCANGRVVGTPCRWSQCRPVTSDRPVSSRRAAGSRPHRANGIGFLAAKIPARTFTPQPTEIKRSFNANSAGIVAASTGRRAFPFRTLSITVAGGGS